MEVVWRWCRECVCVVWDMYRVVVYVGVDVCKRCGMEYVGAVGIVWGLCVSNMGVRSWCGVVMPKPPTTTTTSSPVSTILHHQYIYAHFTPIYPHPPHPTPISPGL